MSMSFWPTVFGGLGGALLALWFNGVVLPIGLQSEKDGAEYMIPTVIGPISSSQYATFLYRFVLPILFTVLFAVGANFAANKLVPGN